MGIGWAWGWGEVQGVQRVAAAVASVGKSLARDPSAGQQAGVAYPTNSLLLPAVLFYCVHCRVTALLLLCSAVGQGS